MIIAVDMELKMLCASWLKEEDEQVLTVLQQSDRWLSAEELSVLTGIPVSRVEQTLRMLRKQRKINEARCHILDEVF